MPAYLDTSAFLKLLVEEEHSSDMVDWAQQEVTRSGSLWSSDLLRTEAVRAARRISPEVAAACRPLLDAMTLIALPSPIFAAAGELDPAVLRSLDAVHLAAALRLGDDLDGVVTYDERMAAATRALGLPVLAPGLD